MKNKVIITAGGTSERIDNVRKITNSSTGKLGFVIANKLIELKDDSIDKIYYVCSKNSYKPYNEKIEIIEVFDTNDLKNTIERLLKNDNINYFIHAMAVSDYTVDFVTTARKIVDKISVNDDRNLYDVICSDEGSIKDTKISSYEDDLIIKLKRTPKIISLIKDLSPSTYLVGFKLLDNVSKSELIDVASKLRDKNKCDLVVANDLSNIRNGHHIAYILRKDNSYIEASDKEDIAIKLVSEMFDND